MRILILGGDGMLGHKLFLFLSNNHETKATLHNSYECYKNLKIFNESNSYFNVDVMCVEKLISLFWNFKPQVVINAVGIVKQRNQAKEEIPTIQINSLFPHNLFLICKLINAKLISISTDCVFNGSKGGYRENDKSDAEDLYGRTKYLGEIRESGCLTLRTSIIGLELFNKTGLIEWFLAQKGTIKGFRKAIFSGLTTYEISKIINLLCTDYPNLSGLFHVSSSPISKYELLSMLAAKLKRAITIVPDDNFLCDRSLNGDSLKKATGYVTPNWNEMLENLAVEIKLREGNSHDIC